MNDPIVKHILPLHMVITMISRLSVMALLTCLALGCAGSASTYNAQSLPAQFSVQPSLNVSTLDLSPLAATSLDTTRIYSGDGLELTVATGTEPRLPDPWKLTVDRDGNVEVPLVGPVNVGNLNINQAQSKIRLASIERGIFRNPSVSIGLGERRTYRITVMGGVTDPGTFDIPAANSDLLAAIMAAGGLSESAGHIVEVREIAAPSQQIPQQSPFEQPEYDVARTQYVESSNVGGPSVRQINLAALHSNPQPTQTYSLTDGAIVTVRELPKGYIHVMGLVNAPSRFEMPPGEDLRLLDAVAIAKGTKVSFADKILIQRIIPGSAEPITIEASIQEAKKDGSKNILLADGDLVSVEETPVTFMLGMAKQVIRVGLTAGTTLF